MPQVNWPQVNILVAEDEDDLRELLVSIFEYEGSHVHSAKDGHEAVDIINRHPIDLVVSDIRMPNCDGIELLETIKKRNPSNPLVFLATGFADIDQKRAKEKGAEGLIFKPFSVPDLLAMLEAKLTLFPRFTRPS